MTTIFKKELSSYLHSWRGYAFIAISLLAIGVLSFVFNFNYGSTRVEILSSYLPLVFAVLSPAIFSNIFSGERNKNTEKLLFSLPFKTTDIVLGKYLAALCLFGINVCFLIILPLIFTLFANVSLASAYVSIFGLVLLYAALMSIVTFVASAFKKTSSVIMVSYLIFAALILLSIVPTVRTSEVLYVLTTFIQKLAFFSRLDNLVSGAFDIEAVIYYLSISVIFLLLSFRNIEKRRIALSSGGSL